MKAVIQRVKQAKVEINGQISGQIQQGLVVLLAVAETDTATEAKALAQKILSLRLFADADNKMNRSITEINGEILVVSQFTLYGDCRRGARPSFVKAAKGQRALELYEETVKILQASKLKIATGEFGADMQLNLTNDGPVTVIVEI